MSLKYLFEAHFNDGTIIQQKPEDVSSLDPAKSTFYDVSQRIDDVTSFGIFSEDHTYAVDLTDGHFEIDGIPFFSNNPTVEIPEGTQYRLIYFRRVKHHFNSALQAIGQDMAYHLGWQVTVDGKNHQQTITVI